VVREKRQVPLEKGSQRGLARIELAARAMTKAKRRAYLRARGKRETGVRGQRAAASPSITDEKGGLATTMS
jgi:hypothetical protein